MQRRERERERERERSELNHKWEVKERKKLLPVPERGGSGEYEYCI